MLEAAWHIVSESFGFSSGTARPVVAKMLGQLKAADIAHRAGLTTGAFYNRWPNREAFLSEFIDYALSVDRSPTYARLQHMVEQHEGDAIALVHDLAYADIQEIVNNPAFAVHTHLWSLMRARPDITDRMDRMYDEFRASITPMFERVLELLGRELRPPFTISDVVQFFMAAAEGLNLQTATGGPNGPSDELFGRCVTALLPTMTRRKGDRTELDDLLAEL